MKKNENKKTKILGLGLLSFLLTSGAIVTPIMLRNFSQNISNINKPNLETWLDSNIVNTGNLDSLLNANSDSLKEHLVNEGIVSSEFGNEIKNVKFVVSQNSYQLNSDKVKLDLVIETNDGNTNETVYGISSSVNIINFDTNKFINELQQIEIGNLSTSLNSTNIKNTIYNMNVGFVESSLENVTVSESTRNNAILKNSFSPFASTTDCVYKLDFTFNTTNDYLFNTNTSTFGDPSFTDNTSLNNCITKAVSPVEFNDVKLKEEISKINDFSVINDLLTNQNSLINLVNQSNIVANNDWISSTNISVSQGQNGKLQVTVNTTLINGQSNETIIDTNINVITFNKEKFMEEMLKENDYNNLTQNNFLNTLTTMDVISDISAVNSNSTFADQLETYREVDGNKYYIYNVNIGLNSNYVIFDGNSISNTITINNVDTIVPKQVNINKNKLELAVANATSSKTAYDSFLQESSAELKQLVIDSGALNIENGNSLIENVVVSKVEPVSTDEFVKVKVVVDFVDSVTENNPATLIVNTGLRIINILENNIRSYFKANVNNDTQVQNGLNTSLIASNANLTSDNLNEQSTTSSSSTPNYAQNDLNNLPCKVVDLNIALNDGFVYLDDSNQIQTQKSITNVLTSIVTDIQLDIEPIIQQIQSINDVSTLNSIMSDKLGFVKQHLTIDNPNWIRNVTLNTENNSGTIAIQGTIELTNGQIINITKTNTQLQVVNFNQQTFTTYIKANVNNNSQLTGTELSKTVIASSSGLNDTNLKTVTATSHNSATADPDRGNNTYFQYDFTFNLNAGYCFYDDVSGQISDSKSVNNVFTSIIDNATVSNIDNVINQIKQNTISVSNLQALLNNAQSVRDIVNNANIVNDNALINNVELTDITDTSDTNITLHLRVTLTTNQVAIDQDIETSIKIVKLDQDALKQYFKTSVTSSEQIDNSHLLETLYNSNQSNSTGILTDCLNSSTSINFNNKYINNDSNVPFNIYNLTLNLNESYCYYDFGSKAITTSQTINDIISSIQYTITPNKQNLINAIQNINSYAKLVDYSTNNSDSLLNFVKDSSLVLDKEWIKNVKNINLSSNSNKMVITFDVELSTGEIINISANTDVTILTFDNNAFAASIANLTSTTQLAESELNTLITSSLTNVPTTVTNAIQSSNSLLSDINYNDTVNSLYYQQYTFDFTLVDQFCFYDGSTLSNSMNLTSLYKTQILANFTISEQEKQNLVDVITNKVNSDINIDNYRNYFTGANKTNSTSNPGRMSIETLGNLISDNDYKYHFKSIKFTSNSADATNGNAILNVEITLNDNYKYNDSSTISFTFTSNIYDPNSQYNISLFNISGPNLNSLTTLGMSKEKLYIPSNIQYMGHFSSTNATLIDVSFATSFQNFPPSYYAGWNSFTNVTKISFEGCTRFKNSNTGTTTMFSAMPSLVEADFSNTGLTNIYNEYLENSPKLEIATFANSKNLSVINSSAFNNCPNLRVIDLSGCPLTQVDSFAFGANNNIQIIYVSQDVYNNPSLKAALITAISNSGATNPESVLRVK